MAGESVFPPRDRSTGGKLRQQIRSQWQDLAAGRASQDATRRWARGQLERSVADNEQFQGVLREFAQWKGVDRARVLGSKLVRNGHLTEDDVTLVLHSVTE